MIGFFRRRRAAKVAAVVAEAWRLHMEHERTHPHPYSPFQRLSAVLHRARELCAARKLRPPPDIARLVVRHATKVN